MKKHFWQSRKFIYAASVVIVSAVMVLLPQFVDMSAETADAVRGLIVYVVIAGVALISGHTITDVAAILAGAKDAMPDNVHDALHEVVDAVVEDGGNVSFAGVPEPEHMDADKPHEAVK